MWGSSCPSVFMTVNPKIVGLSSLSLSSVCPRFDMWTKEDGEGWASCQCPPLATQMTVAFKWSSCLELFMEALSQLGGGLWEHSHLNCYVREMRDGDFSSYWWSREAEEEGTIAVRVFLRIDTTFSVCFSWLVLIFVLMGRYGFKHQ